MADTTPVLIAGAGPTGLTLACELARRGVAFRIVEGAPGPQPGSRGKGVQPRTLEVFDDLGIVDQVLARGRQAMPIRSTGPDGRVTESAAVAFRDQPDIPYPASVITPQWQVGGRCASCCAASAVRWNSVPSSRPSAWTRTA